MVIFDFKEEGTRTEHVAIATSKCVPSGIFVLGCNIPAKFQQYWFQTFKADIQLPTLVHFLSSLPTLHFQISHSVLE